MLYVLVYPFNLIIVIVNGASSRLICQLCRSLYDFKQSPHAWFGTVLFVKVKDLFLILIMFTTLWVTIDCLLPTFLLFLLFHLSNLLRQLMKHCLIRDGNKPWLMRWWIYNLTILGSLFHLMKNLLLVIVGCRWVFNVKVGPGGQVDWLTAQLVARGYTQVYGEIKVIPFHQLWKWPMLTSL